MTEPHDADFRPEMDAPVPAARTLGGQLHAARMARGLSLPDIAARTRIPERTLAAIEADAYDQLPHPTFAAGFIRSLAREVGVSQEEASARYRAENTRLPPSPMAAPLRLIEPERVPSRRLAIVSGVAGALAIVGGVLWFSRDRNAPVVPAPVAASAPAPLVAPTASAITPPPGATMVDPTAPATGPAVAATTPSGQSGAAPLVTAGGAVTLTATQDVWFQIKDKTTGQRVISTVLAQGQTYNVPPGAMELWTGRAGALQVRVNGKLLPLLGGPVETVRSLDLAPAALIARAAGAPAAGAAAQ
jgi:cytoskeleton protein RodZ